MMVYVHRLWTYAEQGQVTLGCVDVSDRVEEEQMLSSPCRPRRSRKGPAWWKDYVDSDGTSSNE